MEEEQTHLLEDRQGLLQWLIRPPVSLFPCQAKEHRPIKQFTKEFLSEENQGVLMCC